MSNTATQTNQAPTHPHLVPVARRQRQPFAAAARWLALALLAGFTLAAQAQRTATATATVMSGFVVDITVTDGGAKNGTASCAPIPRFPDRHVALGTRCAGPAVIFQNIV